jgi:hypothetical protein
MNMINITTIRKRMTKGMLLMVLFLAQTVISSAQVKLYIEDFSVSRADITSAEGKAVSLVLENDVVATQVQVTVDLPEGLAYVPNSAKKTSRVKSGDAYVDASTATGKLVILGTDVNVAAGNGAIITFNVRPDATLKDGDHQIKLTEIVVSDENANQLNTIKESTSKVTMLSLGSCKIEGPELLQAAVNEEYQIDIVLNNEGVDNVAAVSGTVTLPAGMEFVEGEDGKFIRSDRAQSPLSFKVKDFEGYTNFVLSSNRNTVITGSNGVLFSFKVKADATLAENTVIKLSELRVADTDGKSAALDDVEISVKFDVLGAAKYVLTNTLAEAKKVDTTGKTAATVQALNDAIAAGEAALVAEGATAESVKEATTNIQLAMAALSWNLLDFTGVAYIVDIETGKFMAAGHDWGTRGIVNEVGLDLTFTADAETKMVTIDSRVANNATDHFLGSNLYMDAPAANWGLVQVESGIFITDGSKFISIDENDNLVMSEKPRLWNLVTKEQLLEKMAAATAENPVDVTWMIQGANFSRNDGRNKAWQVTAEGNTNLSGGENTNMAAEAYMATFDINQTISGMPSGIYKLQAQAAVTFHDNRAIKDYDGNGYPVIYAGDQTANFNDMVEDDRLTNMGKICGKFTAGEYEIEPIIVKVIDGTLTVGIKSERNDIWAMWDNFRLTYLGKPAKEWDDLVINGDMEGESTECFYVTEQYVGGPFVAVTTAGIGKDGSKALKIQSADDPATDWDTQFFVRLPYELPAGTKFKFSFDYKASVAGSADTQAHNEPSEYIHWAFAGSPNFTTEWQSYTYEGTVPSQCDGNKNANGDYLNNFQSIAFNLAKNKKATEFIIDNVKFEVPWDTKLVATTADNQKPYPVELAAAKSELRVAYAKAKAINTTGKNGADALATAITAAETVLKNTTTATAADATAAKEALSQAVSVFNKANLDPDLVEIAQNQGKDLDDFTRATLAEGAGYNTYTANADLTVAFKMFDIDVKDCDYVVVKFAEPVPAGWSIAFWSKTGNKCVDIPAGQLEYKYEFAKDNECAIANGILPQICVLTLWGAQKPLVMKVEGIYKHKVPVVDGINSIAAERQNGVIFNMNGQKVDKARKGMYIINGKKVVIK